MNLKYLTPEQVKQQLSEAAGWHKRHPSLTEVGFGKPYSNLFKFLEDLKVFIEQSNVTDNEPGKLKLADSKLVEAYRFANEMNLVTGLKMMITEMGMAVGSMKQNNQI